MKNKLPSGFARLDDGRVVIVVGNTDEKEREKNPKYYEVLIPYSPTERLHRRKPFLHHRLRVRAQRLQSRTG